MSGFHANIVPDDNGFRWAISLRSGASLPPVTSGEIVITGTLQECMRELSRTLRLLAGTKGSPPPIHELEASEQYRQMMVREAHRTAVEKLRDFGDAAFITLLIELAAKLLTSAGYTARAELLKEELLAEGAEQ